MGSMNETFRTISIGWPDHVVLVIIDVICGVVARREVDIGTKWRSITVTILVWEAYTSSCISWILDSNSV
jgi:hypothetical protein